MYPISLQDVIELTQGSAGSDLLPSAALDGAVVDGAVIDSRDVQEGDLFFAFAGTRCHGLDHAAAALTHGAHAVVTQDAPRSDTANRHIVVPDLKIALAELAHHNRKRSDALIIGVTGTVGKTTTRRLLASALQTGFTGIQSPNNFNNHLGVPLSLLDLQEGDEFGVIEIATSEHGDIQALSAIAQPEIAVVTRITPVHLTGFDSLKAVQEEKRQLVAALGTDGIAFLNADDPLVMQMAESCSGQVVTYGFSDSANVRISNFEQRHHSIVVTVNGHDYEVPVIGRTQATNVAAAIAVALEVGLAPEQISQGLQQFENMPGRQQVIRAGDWTLVDDTYNSSPASVAAAIECVENLPKSHHRVMILSDMLDLGNQSQDLHFGIGATLAKSSVDHVAVLGEYRDDVVEGFQAAGGHLGRISVFESLNHMMSLADCLLSPGDGVLIKGSRGTQMEHVVSRLQQLAVQSKNAGGITEAGLRRAA